MKFPLIAVGAAVIGFIVGKWGTTGLAIIYAAAAIVAAVVLGLFILSSIRRRTP